MRFNNIQFEEPVDSSEFYDSIEAWVTEGISDFLRLMRHAEPEELKGFDSHTAQVGALRECAELLVSKKTHVEPNFNTLLSWYMYSLMQFISTTFAKVNARLIPDSAVEKGKELDYIENVVIDVLSRHEGVGWENPNLEVKF